MSHLNVKLFFLFVSLYHGYVLVIYAKGYMRWKRLLKDCLVVNPITVGNFAFFFNCTLVGRISESMTVPT